MSQGTFASCLTQAPINTSVLSFRGSVTRQELAGPCCGSAKSCLVGIGGWASRVSVAPSRPEGPNGQVVGSRDRAGRVGSAGDGSGGRGLLSSQDGRLRDPLLSEMSSRQVFDLLIKDDTQEEDENLRPDDGSNMTASICPIGLIIPPTSNSTARRHRSLSANPQHMQGPCSRSGRGEGAGAPRDFVNAWEQLPAVETRRQVSMEVVWYRRRPSISTTHRHAKTFLW